MRPSMQVEADLQGCQSARGRAPRSEIDSVVMRSREHTSTVPSLSPRSIPKHRRVALASTWSAMSRCEDHRNGGGTMSTPERIQFLSAVLLTSREAARLAEFYRDVLGLPLAEERHGNVPQH